VPIITVLLLLLLVGIAVGLKSGKLSWPTFIVCSVFGILLGTTPLGISLAGGLESAGVTIVDSVAGVLS
jgi:hypothetical protein